MDFSFLGGTGADGTYKMNPNFLQLLAGMGQRFGAGQSAGQAIGAPTSEMIRSMQLQGDNKNFSPQNPTPTAAHLPGPNEVITKETADGTVTTVKNPSAQSIQMQKAKMGAFDSQPAPESMESKLNTPTGGVSEQSPFWKALLGQVS